LELPSPSGESAPLHHRPRFGPNAAAPIRGDPNQTLAPLVHEPQAGAAAGAGGAQAPFPTEVAEVADPKNFGGLQILI